MFWIKFKLWNLLKPTIQCIAPTHCTVFVFYVLRLIFLKFLFVFLFQITARDLALWPGLKRLVPTRFPGLCVPSCSAAPLLAKAGATHARNALLELGTVRRGVYPHIALVNVLYNWDCRLTLVLFWFFRTIHTVYDYFKDKTFVFLPVLSCEWRIFWLT